MSKIKVISLEYLESLGNHEIYGKVLAVNDHNSANL